MKKSLFVYPILTLGFFLFVNIGNAFASSNLSATASTFSQHHACAQTAPGFARCLVITHKTAGNQPTTPAGLTPRDLHHAYRLPTTAAAPQTVAIVDAYDDPNAEADLALYRSTFGLPACTRATGCFRKVDQRGGTHYPQPDASWANEIALDLEMVSAIAPNSHLLLVEADSDAFANLASAVNTAVRLGARIVSNSYGVQESSTDAALAKDYQHPGVIITASSGDTGYRTQFPAAFTSVIAVGGTTLSRASNARGWQESAWGGSGSGCSQYISKPAWQQGGTCEHRAVADVAAVADPTTGVAVYDSYQNDGNNWSVDGGTSASAPIIAGVYALAGNAAHVNAASLYQHSNQLNDIVGGSNGTCTLTYLCTSQKGYDGLTGLGSPNGISAF